MVPVIDRVLNDFELDWESAQLGYDGSAGCPFTYTL